METSIGGQHSADDISKTGHAFFVNLSNCCVACYNLQNAHLNHLSLPFWNLHSKTHDGTHRHSENKILQTSRRGTQQKTTKNRFGIAESTEKTNSWVCTVCGLQPSTATSLKQHKPKQSMTHTGCCSSVRHNQHDYSVRIKAAPTQSHLHSDSPVDSISVGLHGQGHWSTNICLLISKRDFWLF